MQTYLSKEINLFLPVHPLSIEIGFDRKRLSQIYDEMSVNSRSWSGKVSDDENIEFKIYFESEIRDEVKDEIRRNKHYIGVSDFALTGTILVFNIDYQISKRKVNTIESTIKKYVSDNNIEDGDAFIEEIIVGEYICRASDIMSAFIISLLISNPGVFDFMKGIFVCEGHQSISSDFPRDINYGLKEYLESNNLNIIEYLDFIDFWQWIFSIGILKEGYSNKAPIKAINYYTKCYSEVATADLIWMVAAIESLICDGQRSIAKDMFKRIKAIFPEFPNQMEKKIRSMYSARSDLVHGAVALPPAYRHIGDYAEKYSDNINDYRKLANILFVSLVQKLFLLKIEAFAFRYALSGK